jgi:hypothetical protein
LKETKLRYLKMLALALAVAALPLTMLSAEETKLVEQKPAKTEEAAAPPKCLKAAVNPVTGFAICLEPKGAPVDPPERSALQRPCKPSAHDGDPFTVYEHWSGCH